MILFINLRNLLWPQNFHHVVAVDTSTVYDENVNAKRLTCPPNLYQLWMEKDIRVVKLSAGVQSLITEAGICDVHPVTICDSNVPDIFDVAQPVHQTSLAESHNELLRMSFFTNSVVKTRNVITPNASLCDSNGSSIQCESSNHKHCDGIAIIVVAETLMPSAVGQAKVVVMYILISIPCCLLMLLVVAVLLSSYLFRELC